MNKVMMWIVTLCLIMLLASKAFAGSVSVGGAYSHTANSNYGDSGNLVLRGEEHLIYDLYGGLEYEYHGRQAHDPYGDLSGHSVLGELIYRPEVDWYVKPYILGGLGWSFCNWDRSQDMADKGIEINVGDALAEKVGVGAEYIIDEHWRLGIEWDYYHSSIPKDSFYTVDGSPANVAGDDNRSGRVRLGQEEISVLASMRCKF